MNIFVGNLSFDAKEEDVQRAFRAFGVVTSVAIVMEKKGKKSRGFGFVEMPDEQEAQAAIDQLHGKEILGRPINVMPALSKEPKSKPIGKRNKYLASTTPGYEPSFKRTGKFKEGRRSLSYIKQRTDAGITASVPRRSYKSNPMRWRKKPRTEARFAKPEGEPKPWQRPQTEAKPWRKPAGKPGPWRKSSADRQQSKFKKPNRFSKP